MQLARYSQWKKAAVSILYSIEHYDKNMFNKQWSENQYHICGFDIFIYQYARIAPRLGNNSTFPVMHTFKIIF